MSPEAKLFKMEQNTNDTKHNKNKISKHDMVALKEKNHQLSTQLTQSR